MDCPACGMTCTDQAEHCDCGFDFFQQRHARADRRDFVERADAADRRWVRTVLFPGLILVVVLFPVALGAWDWVPGWARNAAWLLFLMVGLGLGLSKRILVPLWSRQKK